MASTTRISENKRKIPELIAGDYLDQKTFHERYMAMPEKVKAELIEGIVYLSGSTLRIPASHGFRHSDLIGWLWTYKCATPGIDVCDNATLILGERSEPQPDATMLVLPGYGGQVAICDGYLKGAPELIAEVSLSTESCDLHSKLRDYARAGVKEYLVLLLKQKKVRWYVRERAKTGFVELMPDSEGVLRSPFFGGLWLDPRALFKGDARRLIDVLNRGLASSDRVRFTQGINA